jgi:hypothetical protein
MNDHDVSKQTQEAYTERTNKHVRPLPGVTSSYVVPPDASCGICSSTQLRAGFDPFVFFDQ